MAGKQGFEPRFHDPESCVLPLDDFPAASDMIMDFLKNFNLGKVAHIDLSQLWCYHSESKDGIRKKQ